MIRLSNVGLRALSTAPLYPSFSPAVLPVQSSFFNPSVKALPGQSSFSPFGQPWSQPSDAMCSRVSSAAWNFFPHSNFSTTTELCAPVSYWKSRLERDPFHLDIEVDDLKHLGSLPTWIAKNGLEVQSIAFPYEKLKKSTVKKLSLALSEFYPVLPGFGIRNLAQLGEIEIISQPTLETIEMKGNEMETGAFPFCGVQFDQIPLADERYLNLLAEQITNNSKKNFVVLILSEKYWL